MPTRPRFPCPAPGCHRILRSAVALTFHVRDEHPSGAGEFRPAIREAGRLERRIRAETAEELGRKRLDQLYRGPGCACGNTVEWHMEQRARVGVQ